MKSYRQDLIQEDDDQNLKEQDRQINKPFRTLGRQNAQKDWDEALADQQRILEEDVVAYNQSKFDQFTPIVQRANKQEAIADNDRRIAGAYMLCDAYNNGGMSNRALGEAFTTAFGKPIYGCQIFHGLEGDQATLNGWAGIYGQTQDPQTGKTGIGLIGAMSPQDQLMLLQQSNLGNRTLGARRMLYGELSKGKTADQMQQMGFQNPDGPVVGGGVGGKGVTALAGRMPSRHSRISFFASDGRGGGMRSEYNGHTGERSEEMLGNWAQYDKDLEANRQERIAAAKRKGSGLSFEERMDLEDRRSANRTKEQEARDKSMGGRQDNAAAERRKLQKVRDLGKSIEALRKEQAELDKGTMNITKPEDYEARTSSISEKIASLEKERDSIYSDNDKAIANEGQTASNAGYNGSSDDSAESTDYPGYSNGKAKRALAKGWTWNPDTMRFDPPKGK